MKYIYSAVFTPMEGGEGYCARVPDLSGCVTTGKDLSDAIDQITDAMSAWLCVAEDEELPIAPPTPQPEVERGEGDFCSLIRADTLAYRAATDTRCVRKNVSLPAWMAAMADKRRINCSRLLQESLIRKLDDR